MVGCYKDRIEKNKNEFIKLKKEEIQSSSPARLDIPPNAPRLKPERLYIRYYMELQAELADAQGRSSLMFGMNNRNNDAAVYSPN